jgi:hypothetical protein
VSLSARAARNESLYREVNERISDITQDQRESWTEAFCECSRVECTEKVEITLQEYEGVRAHGARFVLVAGHELSDVERVVDRTDRFLVVEKVGEGGRIAEQLDPRSQ